VRDAELQIIGDLLQHAGRLFVGRKNLLQAQTCAVALGRTTCESDLLFLSEYSVISIAQDAAFQHRHPAKQA